MTIWLLALLLLASLAAAGYRQGAIRAGISFFGIIIAALLAVPLGKLVGPLLKILGLTNPILLWVLPPLVAFVAVLALVKIGAFMVHQKVDVSYKYKAGDLRLSLFERLNHRLGACVGLLNGAVYLVLLTFVIHAVSYWSVQVASGESDPRVQRLVSQLGRDLQSTGMDRVAKAVDSLPAAYYDTADLAGLLYQNTLLEARFMRYPGFLSLGERAEFQTLGQDAAFAEMRLRQSPLREVMAYPAVRAVFDNPELLRTGLGDRAAGHEGFARVPGNRQVGQVRRGTSVGPLEFRCERNRAALSPGQAKRRRGRGRPVACLDRGEISEEQHRRRAGSPGGAQRYPGNLYAARSAAGGRGKKPQG